VVGVVAPQLAQLDDAAVEGGRRRPEHGAGDGRGQSNLHAAEPRAVGPDRPGRQGYHEAAPTAGPLGVIDHHALIADVEHEGHGREG
jgi:hypothetical protein